MESQQKTEFYSISQDGQQFKLEDPKGDPFLTIGLNHLDASNLRYSYNLRIWKEKYHSDSDYWIRNGVVKDLESWGFNTIGWTQECVGGKLYDIPQQGKDFNLVHSDAWCEHAYRIANMPYVLQLRTASIENWNGHPVFPDVFSEEFEEYVDWLIRNICAQHEENSNLIGYFYVDIISWKRHFTGLDFPQLVGLEGTKREDRLFEIAQKYYETIYRAIRKYDANHLILGDRYDGNQGIPEVVLYAMKPYVDVFSVQYFPECTETGIETMTNDLSAWQKITGKPVILADIGNSCPTLWNAKHSYPLNSQAERAEWYVKSIGPLLKEPWFLGWHWCSYIENYARGWGCKNPYDEAYRDFIEPVREFNRGAMEEYQKRFQ
jgi:hypothetical protein